MGLKLKMGLELEMRLELEMGLKLEMGLGLVSTMHQPLTLPRFSEARCPSVSVSHKLRSSTSRLNCCCSLASRSFWPAPRGHSVHVTCM